MKIRFVVTLLVCLLALPMRLPAPISEITTPTPAANATKAPQRKILFAGTWKGRVIMRHPDSKPQVTDETIVVSTNERSVNTSSAGHYSCKRNGDTLNWSDYNTASKSKYSLSLKGANSAAYLQITRYAGFTFQTAGTLTG